MLRARVIPALLLRNESLVKTVRFGRFTYVGDPANTVRIFNELEVDELLFLDITATRERRAPNLKVLGDIADECFMPLAYGGGVRSLDRAKAIFDVGFEKVAVNAGALDDPSLITRLATAYGSQAIIASIDAKKDVRGRLRVRHSGTRRKTAHDPVSWARELESRGAGEILITAVDREGTWAGFDLELTTEVVHAVGIPVIAHGGAGTVDHIRDVMRVAGASAVALGSMVVFQKQGMGVLVNMPDRGALARAIGGN